MKEELKRRMDNFHRYNSGDMAFQVFGLDSAAVYDALVVAPSFTPVKIITDDSFKITLLAQRAYTSGYLVEKDGLKIAWIQIGSGACNLIDYIMLCAELTFRKLIFVGAVGSLTEKFDIGDLCTPSCSIAGVYANTYLKESLADFVPFERVVPETDFVEKVIALAQECGYALHRAPVFCTDSIALEYSHLDEIKAMGAELIEMETSSFYLMAKLLEVPAAALLIVSDNSATGKPLVGRDEAIQAKYDSVRKVILPDLIFKAVKTIK